VVLIGLSEVMTMPNKHFCQGTTCHTRTTQDRFLKSRGVVRGRYASLNMNYDSRHNGYYDNTRSKFFCSTSCQDEWLNANMENIEQGRPIEFIRHRRESQGYHKVKNDSHWGSTYSIERVDNRTEIE
jgi:hypothetical protein